MLELKDLGCELDSVPILSGLNLKIETGAKIALLGPSGSGKTTLLRLIAGLERPRSGTILWKQSTWSAGQRIQVEANKRSVGLVFQNLALWPQMSVREHLKFVSPRSAQSTIDQLLGQFRLDLRAEARPSELSGGERQRLAIARTLIHEPEILLLDEPIVQLDRKLQIQVLLDLMSWLDSRPEVTAILVTHNRDIAESFSNELMTIDHGTLIFRGSFPEARHTPTSTKLAEVLGYGSVFKISETTVSENLGWPKLRDGQSYYWLPENVCIATSEEPGATVPATVLNLLYRNMNAYCYLTEVQYQSERFRVIATSEERLPRNKKIALTWNAIPQILSDQSASDQST